MFPDDPRSTYIIGVGASYTLEKEGEELTFIISDMINKRKDALIYSGVPEEVNNRLIVYIGPSIKDLDKWLVEKFKEVYAIIPDIFALQDLLKQAGYL
jgi:hypothetical protein